MRFRALIDFKALIIFLIKSKKKSNKFKIFNLNKNVHCNLQVPNGANCSTFSPTQNFAVVGYYSSVG